MIDLEQQNKLQTELTELSNKLDFFIVNSEETYTLAANELIKIKKYKKLIDDMFNSSIKKAHDAHKSLLSLKKQFTDRIDITEISLNKSIRLYNIDQQRIADELRIKAMEEAKKAEEEEKAKLVIEAQKILEEDNEEDNIEKANFILKQVDTVKIFPDDVPTSLPPKIEGIGSRKAWKAKIINKDLVPIKFNDVEIRPIDQTALNKLARENKGNIEIPGVKFYEDDILVISTK